MAAGEVGEDQVWWDGGVRTETIRDESIRLGQFLKLAGLIEVGGDAKAVLGDARVRVNGLVETRRGRQVRPGDVVSLDDDEVTVASGAGQADPAEFE